VSSTKEIRKPGSHRGYLPTLDGWRAVAIVAVMFTHDRLHTLGRFSTRWLYERGNKGVDVFFAISGILICSRLLEEEHLLGGISLRNFYLRRAFRILPAALAYLIAIAVLGAAGIIIVHRGEWLAALFFCRNYTSFLGYVGSHQPWFTGHFWSLSVEEHFYLLLPGILVLTAKRWRIQVLSLTAAVVILNRAIQLQHRPWNWISFHTDIRLDALLIPALLAVVMRTSLLRSHIYAVLKWWPLYALVVLLIIPQAVGSIWQTTALAALMPAVIMGSVLHSQNTLGRILESAPLRYIGRISYGLYLWQMLFFTGHMYLEYPLGILERWPWNFIATFILALMSYHWLEKPLMKLGHRIAPPATPGREDLPENRVSLINS
jgi:peptidoglycan/LPS O-acetylase OafA/YrhL